MCLYDVAKTVFKTDGIVSYHLVLVTLIAYLFTHVGAQSNKMTYEQRC